MKCQGELSIIGAYGGYSKTPAKHAPVVGNSVLNLLINILGSGSHQKKRPEETPEETSLEPEEKGREKEDRCNRTLEKTVEEPPARYVQTNRDLAGGTDLQNGFNCFNNRTCRVSSGPCSRQNGSFGYFGCWTGISHPMPQLRKLHCHRLRGRLQRRRLRGGSLRFHSFGEWRRRSPRRW